MAEEQNPTFQKQISKFDCINNQGLFTITTERQKLKSDQELDPEDFEKMHQLDNDSEVDDLPAEDLP